MTQHTPGPWGHSHTATPEYARQSTVYAESDTLGRDIALVYDGQHHEADTALIAAAPDMKQEGEYLLDALLAYDDARTNDEWAHLWEHYRAMRAALDKAEGE